MAEVDLPGTQPNELALLPEPSSTCGCHNSFDSTTSSEPGESYRATMMALSGRDPIFRAALQVSYADRPELTDLCLRCHVPAAWLAGRSEPADGSLLTEDDLEGVTCDICHRAIANDPPLIGDGQYVLSPQTDKRAPRGATPFGGHGVIRDDYVSSSEMCGTCHSLFNPAENAHDADGNDLGIFYYEQRTYEEWVDSVYPGQGKTCVTCHMKRTSGAAVQNGDRYDDLAVHNFVGGNTFAVQAVQILYPNIGISGQVGQVERWVEEQMGKAAELEITQTVPTQLAMDSGQEFEVSVRITNKTGHKLPSGYPEGRRLYLEVTLALPGRAPEVLSGQWDQPTGVVIRDEQFRAYETEHGRVENGVGQRTHHLILMNQVITDTRIPPEGFTPSFPDMVPSGRSYGGSAPYNHWDDHTYRFTAPDVVGTVTGTVTVRAMYQTTDGEVIDFLIRENQGRKEATDLALVWERLGHAPPRPIARATTPITVTERSGSSSDAGVSADAGRSQFEIGDGGCGCRTVGRGAGVWGMWWLVVLVWSRRLSRGGLSRSSLTPR